MKTAGNASMEWTAPLPLEWNPSSMVWDLRANAFREIRSPNQFCRNYQPDVRQQHGFMGLPTRFCSANNHYNYCNRKRSVSPLNHWNPRHRITHQQNYVLLLKIEWGNTLKDCCSNEQLHWQQKWGTNVKCVSISHYIKLNYWNRDVNVSKAGCRRTRVMKKGFWSYTSYRIETYNTTK